MAKIVKKAFSAVTSLFGGSSSSTPLAPPPPSAPATPQELATFGKLQTQQAKALQMLHQGTASVPAAVQALTQSTATFAPIESISGAAAPAPVAAAPTPVAAPVVTPPVQPVAPPAPPSPASPGTPENKAIDDAGNSERRRRRTIGRRGTNKTGPLGLADGAGSTTAGTTLLG